MNKFTLKFILSYLKKAIFNLERANALDLDAVPQETIDMVKQATFYYQLQLNKEEEE